ncbi:hypothetical protein D3C76_1635010 [compost metagenome]
MQATQLQAFVGHAGDRQVAQAVAAFVMGGAVVARVTDVEQVGDGDAVVTLQAFAEQATK